MQNSRLSHLQTPVIDFICRVIELRVSNFFRCARLCVCLITWSLMSQSLDLGKNEFQPIEWAETEKETANWISGIWLHKRTKLCIYSLIHSSIFHTTHPVQGRGTRMCKREKKENAFFLLYLDRQKNLRSLEEHCCNRVNILLFTHWTN